MATQTRHEYRLNRPRKDVNNGKNLDVWAVALTARFALVPNIADEMRFAETDTGRYHKQTDVVFVAADTELMAKKYAISGYQNKWRFKFVDQIKAIAANTLRGQSSSLYGPDNIYYAASNVVSCEYGNYVTQRHCRMLTIISARNLQRGQHIANFNDHLVNGNLRQYRITSVKAPKTRQLEVVVRATNGLYNSIELSEYEIQNWFLVEDTRNDNTEFLDGKGV